MSRNSVACINYKITLAKANNWHSNVFQYYALSCEKGLHMIYVLNQEGQPLMPTKRHGKVRHLLEKGKAKVVKRTPFTIQLLYKGENYTQDITLGIDAGSKHIGVSASTDTEELYSSEVELRNDIVKLLSSRRALRSSRRNRKTRHRKARFDNRAKGKGWLAPSVRQKIDTHLKVVDDIHKILPITEIVVETAQFDIQKIKNPDISGTEYQEGEQLNSWNIREYVLFRDNHTCHHCKGKSKELVLNTHHIESRKTGGDAPNNLITLCKTCHDKFHKDEIELNIKRGQKFNHATFMGVMRWAFYNVLKEKYPNVKMTFGYITKNTRIENNLQKSHHIDALCIAGHPKAKQLDYYQVKKVRCHNRQIHKLTINKGGTRKNNQAPYIVKGFRLFDKVSYEGKECFIFGRRTTGYFDLRKLDGTTIHKSASYKKLKLIKPKGSYLIERKKVC